MLSVENQKYLLSIANLYKEVAVVKVRENKSLDDEYDKPECIEVIENNDFEKYSYLDTFVRDKLMETLCDTFCFIDPSILWKLSDIVTNAIEDNNKACKNIHNADAIIAISKENKEFMRINSMLIKYARTLNPDSILPTKSNLNIY